jgi:hypothetical protein
LSHLGITARNQACDAIYEGSERAQQRKDESEDGCDLGCDQCHGICERFVSINDAHCIFSAAEHNLPPWTVAIVVERVVLMLKTMLSISASAERRACASEAVRGMAEPTSAGAKLVMVLFIFVAMFVRALLIMGAVRAVALEADMVTILGK